jgi:hypothetical protein
MSALATILAVLVCAAAAGVTALAVFERREARNHAASRAEELYALVEGFDQCLAAYFAMCSSTVAQGRDCAPLEEAGWLEMMRESVRARTLVSFYFPALWPQMTCADAAISQAAATLRRYEADFRDEAAARSVERSLAELKDAMESLKGAIVAAHRNARRPGLPRRRSLNLPRLRPAA